MEIRCQEWEKSWLPEQEGQVRGRREEYLGDEEEQEGTFLQEIDHHNDIYDLVREKNK